MTETESKVIQNTLKVSEGEQKVNKMAHPHPNRYSGVI